MFTLKIDRAGHAGRSRFGPLVSLGLSEQESKPILTRERYVVTVAVAASIIASVRLAKVADLDLSISKVVTTVQQSVRLARTILDEALR